jgi:uncharacterized protein (TIGR00297 family)
MSPSRGLSEESPSGTACGEASSASAETKRQLVHIATGAFALLLRWITPTEAMVVAAAALVFNVYALPRIAAPLFRRRERHRHVDPGIVFYPASMLLLILLFPDRLDIVAASWGIMAAGEGMATIVGRHVSSPVIPWNRRRTVAGSAAFVVFGGAAGAFLCGWCAHRVIPPAYPWFSVWMPIVAAVAAAAAETLPIRLDDNISVPVVSASLLWSTSLLNEELVRDTLSHTAAVLPTAVVANGLVAAVGYYAATVTRSGALCGCAIGILILATAGWSGWVLLLTTFALAVIASRAGLQRKMRLGIAEPRGGRRGVANALANTGIAAGAAVLCATTYATDAARVAFVAALAAGGSDTVASEIGKAWGRRTYLVTTLGPAEAGTSGAVSLEGTLAGIAAAALLAGVARATGVIPAAALLPIVVSASIGSLVESALAARFEREGILDNDTLNLINTAIAALSAVWFVTAAA